MRILLVALLLQISTFLYQKLSTADAFSFNNNKPKQPELSRRQWVEKVTSTATIVTMTTASSWTVFTPSSQAATADMTAAEYIKELQTIQSKLQEIPNLLQQQEWDKVRTILKTPPVNKLWNLSDTQNTILKLAKSSGNVELFELKDDIAYNLQMTDQFTYDNVFVYYQPGNGKVKIKEPTEAIQKAIQQLNGIIAENR